MTFSFFCSDKPSRNLVDILLNMREKEDRFTDQEIADEVLTILFAVSILQLIVQSGSRRCLPG